MTAARTETANQLTVKIVNCMTLSPKDVRLSLFYVILRAAGMVEFLTLAQNGLPEPWVLKCTAP